MPTTSTAKVKQQEETSTTIKKKSSRHGFFWSKFRLHHFGKDKTSNKASKTPPSVVSVGKQTNTTTMDTHLGRKNAPDSSSLQPKTLFRDRDAHTTTTTNKPKLQSSWLSRSKWFTTMSNTAFDVVDADGSGTVDEKELYSGLLLIHLKLGCYAGPAACRPVDRQRVHDVFQNMDVDENGTLDKEEFKEVMMVLCSNVLTRVMVQWSMTLIIVPLVAQYILNALYFCHHHVWKILSDLDEYSPIMNAMECWIEDARDVVIAALPRIVIRMWHVMAMLVNKVPESVWNTVPLTLLSCILGCLAVPYIIFQIDDYFQAMADQKKQTVQQQQQEESVKQS